MGLRTVSLYEIIWYLVRFGFGCVDMKFRQ
jgi:hypothetical protein